MIPGARSGFSPSSSVFAYMNIRNSSGIGTISNSVTLSLTTAFKFTAPGIHPSKY